MKMGRSRYLIAFLRAERISRTPSACHAADCARQPFLWQHDVVLRLDGGRCRPRPSRPSSTCRAAPAAAKRFSSNRSASVCFCSSVCCLLFGLCVALNSASLTLDVLATCWWHHQRGSYGCVVFIDESTLVLSLYKSCLSTSILKRYRFRCVHERTVTP